MPASVFAQTRRFLSSRYGAFALAVPPWPRPDTCPSIARRNNSLPQPCCRFGLRHGRALDTVHSFSARFESSSARGEWHSMSTASRVQQMSLSVLIGVHS
jgi:hypothetical protein